MNKSFFLTPEDAAYAFERFVEPTIEAALKTGYSVTKGLHIIVLNPTVQYIHGPDGKSIGQSLPILLERSFNKESWGEKRYDQNAYAKAMLSWRTGFSSREVVSLKPHLLVEGNFRHGGSAVVDGTISAASGVESHFDELFSHMASAAMNAYARHRLMIYEKERPNSHFINFSDD